MDLFIAVGQNGLRVASWDGRSWSAAQTGREGETYRAAAFGNGVCVAVGSYGGENLLAVTRNGVDWKTEKRSAGYVRYLRGLGFGGGTFVGLGGDPGSVGDSKPFVSLTREGERWTDYQPIPGRNVLRRLAWGGGRFVAVGDRGRRAASPDGTAWTDAPAVRALDTLIDVAFGNGVFVGVGLHGLRMASRDGLTWDRRFPGEEGEHLNSVLWDGRRFVAVGQGATYFSPDGSAWERRPNRDAPLTAVYGGGVFVGAAWKGRLLRSQDAVTWEQVHKLDLHAEALAFGRLSG